jgi:allantoin racemase
MKVIVVNIPAAEENSVSGQFIKNVLGSLMRRNFDLFKQKDTEVTFRFPSRGVVADAWADCSYLDHINPESMLPAVVRAEEEGFDAAIIACFHDEDILWEARQTVNIPVVGIAESCLLMATLTGQKFGFIGVSPDPDHPDPVRTTEMIQWITRHNLMKQYVGVKVVRGTGRDQEMALTDAGYEIESIKKAVRKLISDGAKLIFPTCGLMPSVLRLAPGAEKKYPNGLNEVDGIPIINSLGITLKAAEMLVESKSAGFLPIHRKNARVTSSAGDLPGFWDC